MGLKPPCTYAEVEGLAASISGSAAGELVRLRPFSDWIRALEEWTHASYTVS